MCDRVILKRTGTTENTGTDPIGRRQHKTINHHMSSKLKACNVKAVESTEYDLNYSCH